MVGLAWLGHVSQSWGVCSTSVCSGLVHLWCVWCLVCVCQCQCQCQVRSSLAGCWCWLLVSRCRPAHLTSSSSSHGWTWMGMGMGMGMGWQPSLGVKRSGSNKTDGRSLSQRDLLLRHILIIFLCWISEHQGLERNLIAPNFRVLTTTARRSTRLGTDFPSDTRRGRSDDSIQYGT